MQVKKKRGTKEQKEAKEKSKTMKSRLVLFHELCGGPPTQKIKMFTQANYRSAVPIIVEN